MIVDYRVFKGEVPKIQLAEQLAHDQRRIDELTAKLHSAQTQGTPADLHAAREALKAAKSALAGQDKKLLGLGPQNYSPDMFNKLRAALHAANASLDRAAGFIANA
jgi:hypothetical protein